MRSIVTRAAAATMVVATLVMARSAAPLALGSEAVVGKTLHVNGSSATCSDNGAGSASRPYCTISRAALRVRAGQTVSVAAGLYAEIVSISSSGTASAPIVFTAAPGATVTLARRANGFRLWHKRWVTVKGFTVTNTRGYGITVQNSSHITISNNYISHTGRPRTGETRSGISFSKVSDSEISGNTVDHTTGYGINLVDGSNRNLVHGNVSFDNAQVWRRAASGIRVFRSMANTILANVLYENEDSGLEFDQAANNTVRNNVSFENGDHGIDMYKSPGTQVAANIVYANLTAGINVEGKSTGVTITFNVSVDNAVGGPRTRSNIRVESGSTAGTTMDHDQVYLSTPDVLVIWDNVNYATLAALQAATGQERQGSDAAPNWAQCDVHETADGSREEIFRVPNEAFCTLLHDAHRGRSGQTPRVAARRVATHARPV